LVVVDVVVRVFVAFREDAAEADGEYPPGINMENVASTAMAKDRDRLRMGLSLTLNRCPVPQDETLHHRPGRANRTAGCESRAPHALEVCIVRYSDRLERFTASA
jgi:hypothetical protein